MSSTSPQGGGESAGRIVAIARSWIGTPYVHQASVKDVGCDCLGLLRGVWRELRGEEPEAAPPYSPDWAEATGRETLREALARHLAEISPCEAEGEPVPARGRGAARAALFELLQPGDVALFRMSPRGPAKHCGIVASRARSIEAPRVILRSERSQRLEGRAGRLRMTRADLTLIHARQNKRVSEEPFSPFWLKKLAFAFRI
ncbi:MAG TPA: hypothetical protein VHC42_06420 [Rhizomicrobium sp.]|nr:hypothetical protein [Rhizomicrobium sp.]